MIKTVVSSGSQRTDNLAALILRLREVPLRSDVDYLTFRRDIDLLVVDDKTGRKSFDLTEVLNGMGLQMLLYLFTLKNQGQSLYGLPVEGAGVDSEASSSFSMRCSRYFNAKLVAFSCSSVFSMGKGTFNQKQS